MVRGDRIANAPEWGVGYVVATRRISLANIRPSPAGTPAKRAPGFAAARVSGDRRPGWAGCHQDVGRALAQAETVTCEAHQTGTLWLPEGPW